MALSEQNLNLLLQANRILSSTLDEKEVLLRIMELANEIVGAEAASILLLDPATNELYFDVAIGEKGDEIKEVRLKPGEGIAGWVALEKKPLIVNNVKNDPRWSSKIDQQADFSTNSILAAPLMFKGRLLGVIEVINKSDQSDFSGDDLQILQAFSTQAAISVETAQLFSKLKSEKEKFELIFTQMTDAAVFADHNANIVFSNDSFKKIIPSASGPIFSAFSDFNSKPALEEAFTGNGRITGIEFSHKQNQIFLSGWLSKISAENGKTGYLLALHNTTEEKKEQLLKRTFLSLMSHKLKTPLVSIVGYSDLLLQKLSTVAEKLNGADRPAVDVINRQGQYLNSLVEKLLNFVAIEHSGKLVKKNPVSLRETVYDSKAGFSELFEKNGVQFSVDAFINEMPPVNCDRDKIKLVIDNLLENAVKFNDKAVKKIAVSRYDIDGMTGLSITDNGNGIPEEQKDRLFEEFHQIEQYFTGQVKGIGLGLALCRIIIKAHGGKIGFESAIGSGSSFYFALPA